MTPVGLRVEAIYMLAPHDRTNFDTLTSAFRSGDVALVEVQRVHDQKPVAAVCAVSFQDGAYLITPFAILVEGDPFELFNPPDPDGGFITGEVGP